MKRIVPLLLAALLLTGCGEQVPEDTQPAQSIAWEEVPQLNHGVLEYEKLTVEPWYCGRLEYSGKNKWAETELGYYFYSGGRDVLFYADKVNMSNWVGVCNRPNCQHSRMDLNCNAHLFGHGLWIRDGRIFFAAKSNTGKNQPMYLGEHMVPIIASRALDGTDLRIEHVYGELAVKGGGYFTAMASPTWYLMWVGEYNPDGTSTGRYYLQKESGLELVVEQEEDRSRAYPFGRDPWLGGLVSYNAFYGEDTFQLDLLAEYRGDPAFSLYRFVNGELERVDCDGYEGTGKYLSGNTLRLYRENDGYYDLDLVTRQETFLCEAQLENATATILLPNCIVEYNSEQMVLFDGESWQAVEFPQELRGMPMAVNVMASDRIFLTSFDMHRESTTLYQVVLGQESLRLEFCAEMGR